MFGIGKNINQSNGAAAAKSTQSFLDVAEVKDGVIIMKDGNLRGILAVSSVNFALKSEDEQKAIINAYQSFLNALEFGIEILMQSRRIDVAPYLELMKNRMASVTNQLLQMQIAEYVEFISRLTEEAHIMTRRFYVVVPYNVVAIREGLLGRVGKIFNPAHSLVLNAASFGEHKAKLQERLGNIQGGLSSLGLDSLPLETTEIIELLYTSYNIGSTTNLEGEMLSKLEING